VNEVAVSLAIVGTASNVGGGVADAASNSVMIAPHAVAEVPPHVIVVPVNPLLRDTTSVPVSGDAYPTSASSVQLVGGVRPAGLVRFDTIPIVGFSVAAAAPKVAAGVVPAPALFSASRTTDETPAAAKSVIVYIHIAVPVAGSTGRSNVTVCAEAVAKASETNVYVECAPPDHSTDSV
jgi:hypothetical protein